MRDIKRRIGSVKNIQQITKAMELVSATKLRRAQQAVETARPYAEKLQEVLGRLDRTRQAVGRRRKAAASAAGSTAGRKGLLRPHHRATGAWPARTMPTSSAWRSRRLPRRSGRMRLLRSAAKEATICGAAATRFSKTSSASATTSIINQARDLSKTLDGDVHVRCGRRNEVRLHPVFERGLAAARRGGPVAAAGADRRTEAADRDAEARTAGHGGGDAAESGGRHRVHLRAVGGRSARSACCLATSTCKCSPCWWRRRPASTRRGCGRCAARRTTRAK